MAPTPSAVHHYTEAGGPSTGHVHHSKVNAIFQAAKKDLLKVFQLQVWLIFSDWIGQCEQSSNSTRSRCQMCEFFLVFLEGLRWFRCSSMGVCEANSDIKKVIKKRFPEEAPCVFV